MKRYAWIALLAFALVPLAYGLAEDEDAASPKPNVPAATSDVPDSAWDAPPPVFTDPQTAAVLYMAAVLRDKREHASTLTADKKLATQEFMAAFQEAVEAGSLRIETVTVASNRALVVTESQKLKLEEEHPAMGHDPRIVLTLKGGTDPQRQPWLITHVDIKSAAQAKRAVEGLKVVDATRGVELELSKAPYRIGVGDEIRYGSLGRTYTVQADGTITWPPLGPVWASGLTVRELHDRLEEGFENRFETTGVTLPPITVTPAKVITGVATAAEVPPPPVASSPRAVAEAYMKATVEGRVDDAVALAKPDSNAGRHDIEMLGKGLGGKPPVLETVLVSEQAGEAAALFLAHFTASEMLAEFTSAKLPPDLPCRLLLLLSQVEDAWCVSGMEIGDKSAANELRSFQANRRDAVFDWIAERKPNWDVDRSPPLTSAYAPPPTQYQRAPYAPPVAVPRPPRPYRFLEGDEIDFECGADPELDRKLIVLPDGTITLRLLGQVKAAGLTVAELRERLEEAYQEYYHTPGITVTPIRGDAATTGDVVDGTLLPGISALPPNATSGGMLPSWPVGSTPSGMLPANPTPRFLEGRDIMVSWSGKGDAIWGYSKSLGKWTKQEIQPAAEKGLMPVISSNVVFLQVGRFFYGYSGQTGRWHKLTLPEEPKEAPASVYDDTVVLTVEDNIYTFANATGRWTSRDGSIGDSTETTPEGVAGSTQLVTELRVRCDRLRKEAAYLVSTYRNTPEERRESDALSAFRSDLTTSVRAAFAARQQLQRAELAAFRRRLDALEKQIDDRDGMQDEIVERRVEELLHPNLKWEPAVAEPEAGDTAGAGGAGERVPAVSRVNSPQFEIDTYFCPTPDSSTRVDVASAGESVFLVLDVTNLERRSLADLTVSLELDKSLKLQTASEGYEREGNLLTWQNRSVAADVIGRYGVECLCLQPSPSIKCRAVVTDARGRRQACDVSLRIDPVDASEGAVSDEWTMLPKEEPPSDSGTPDRSAVLRMLVGKEDSNNPLLLFFNADWCVPCKVAWPEIRRLRGEGVTVLDVNVNTYRDAARDCEVDRIPTTLFCKDGAEVDRIVGVRIGAFVEKHRNEMEAIESGTTVERVAHELDSLQGFWGARTAISNVDQIPIPKDLNQKWIEGDILNLQSDDEGKSSGVVRYRLNPYTIPRQLDLLPDGPLDVPRYGIYAIEGDRLSLVFGSKRPTGFDVDPNDRQCLLWELTRQDRPATSSKATDLPAGVEPGSSR